MYLLVNPAKSTSQLNEVEHVLVLADDFGTIFGILGRLRFQFSLKFSLLSLGFSLVSLGLPWFFLHFSLVSFGFSLKCSLGFSWFPWVFRGFLGGFPGFLSNWVFRDFSLSFP